MKKQNNIIKFIKQCWNNYKLYQDFDINLYDFCFYCGKRIKIKNSDSLGICINNKTVAWCCNNKDCKDITINYFKEDRVKENEETK